MKKVLITNKVLILRILIVLLLFGVVSIFFATIYIKKTALTNLAEDDARKTSELIFENMYTRMQEGWAKEDLAKILKRMEHIREGLKVHSYRSSKVEEILGENKQDKLIVKMINLSKKLCLEKSSFLFKKMEVLDTYFQ